MKKSLIAFALTTVITAANAQNVGIGTALPQRKFSVNGSIAVDHDGRNLGNLDSAALIFGNDGLTGISSTKIGLGNTLGLDMWTNGIKRFSLNQAGNAGIGIMPDNTHRLRISGKFNATGNISTNDSLIVNGNAGIGIAPHPSYRLSVGGSSHFTSDGIFDGSVTTYGSLVSGGTLSVYAGAVIGGELQGYRLKASHSLNVAGHTSIGGSLDTNFRLRVYDGDSRFGGSMEASGNMTIGGSLDNTYRLRVVGGNSRFGGDAQVTGRTAIGGDVDDAYRLRVWDGNSRFGGNVEVTGQINTASMSVDALSIGGKGSVKSDGLSPLRIGFNSKYVDVTIPGGATQEYTVNITDFTGDNDDVRVMVSQFAHAAGGSELAYERSIISITNVDAANDTCKLKIHNTGSGQIILKGTIYLTCIAKN